MAVVSTNLVTIQKSNAAIHAIVAVGSANNAVIVSGVAVVSANNAATASHVAVTSANSTTVSSNKATYPYYLQAIIIPHNHQPSTLNPQPGTLNS